MEGLGAVASGVRFDTAYRDCFAFVYRSVQRLGVDPNSIEDVVQDVFLVVHRRWSDFDPSLSLRGWIYGILARVAGDHRRSKRRRTRLIEPLDSSALPASPMPESGGPERLAEQQQALSQLARLLSQLNPSRREVLVLSELEQLTVPEIAQALGANVNTIYSRLAAARRQFSELYAAEQANAAAEGTV
jgi:RNA polymerase sigma-70 factor (ECF subfamily)